MINNLPFIRSTKICDAIGIIKSFAFYSFKKRSILS